MQNDQWSWLNHGRYFHSCGTFPIEALPAEGDPYYQQALVAAGKYYDTQVQYLLEAKAFTMPYKIDCFVKFCQCLANSIL